MRKLLLAGAALAALAVVVPARADPILLRIDGTCAKAVILNEPRNVDECQSYVIQQALPNGRIGFMFTLAKGPAKTDKFLMISFFGDGANQVHLTADSVVQPFDTVLLNSGPPPMNSKAVAAGTCRYSNPYKPAAFLRCTGDSDEGSYDFAFTVTGVR